MEPLPAIDVRSGKFDHLPSERLFSKQLGANPVSLKPSGEESGQESSPPPTDTVALTNDLEPVISRVNSGVRLTVEGQYSVSEQAQWLAQTRAAADDAASDTPIDLRSLAGEVENTLPQEIDANITESMAPLSGVDNTQLPLFAVDSPSAAVSSNAAAESLTTNLPPDLAAYLEMIKQLSKDDASVQEFIDRVEASANIGSSTTSGAASSSSTIQFAAMSAQELQAKLEVHYADGQSVEAVSAQIRQTQQQQIQTSDPLVLDLDGGGVDLTSAEEGVSFDIAGTGQASQTAFVASGDAFLAIDRNRNGRIDNGKELFGDQNGAQDGFEELRKLDENQDGVIDVNDAAYNNLLLYNDINRDGVSQFNELRSLVEANIQSISLNDRSVDETISGGNRLVKTASFTRNDGSKGMVGDVLLNYLA
ncbi:MAG: hypothetical protein AB1656_14515 [Candidatus Omnitrophota bacterium]